MQPSKTKTMPADVAERICWKRESIEDLLQGSSLYGYPIDVSNMDHVIVAAYYMGQQHTLRRTSTSTKQRLRFRAEAARKHALEHDGDPVEELGHVLPSELPAEEWLKIISDEHE